MLTLGIAVWNKMHRGKDGYNLKVSPKYDILAKSLLIFCLPNLTKGQNTGMLYSRGRLRISLLKVPFKSLPTNLTKKVYKIFINPLSYEIRAHPFLVYTPCIQQHYRKCV